MTEHWACYKCLALSYIAPDAEWGGAETICAVWSLLETWTMKLAEKSDSLRKMSYICTIQRLFKMLAWQVKLPFSLCKCFNSCILQVTDLYRCELCLHLIFTMCLSHPSKNTVQAKRKKLGKELIQGNTLPISNPGTDITTDVMTIGSIPACWRLRASLFIFFSALFIFFSAPFVSQQTSDMV